MILEKIKALVQNIYLHFDTTPSVIKVENLQFYVVANLAETLAWATHFIWCCLFFYLGINQLAVLQIISVAAYVLAINLNRKAFHMWSMFVALFEISVHQIIVSFAIGYQCGFQYFIPVVAIFPFLIPHGNRIAKWSLLIMCIVSYLSIEYLIKPHTPIFSLQQGWIYFFNTSNIITAFGMFAMWAIFFTVSVTRSHKMLEKERLITAEAEKAIERAAQLQLIQQEKMNALGKLTAGVAHEINNPINFVSGAVVSLKRDLDDVKSILKTYDEKMPNEPTISKLKKEIDFDYTMNEMDELISTIESGASRTADIVKGLRSFARLDEGQMKDADVNETLKNTLDLLQSKFNEKIKLKTEFAELPKLYCNPSQLNQVWMNVLNNALDAIFSEGEIFVSTKFSDNTIFVSIKDNGSGMSEEVKQKIFDPFFTTKEIGKGTGLGLSVAFSIIAEHNGKIEVESEVGKGTKFIISLPIS